VVRSGFFLPCVSAIPGNRLSLRIVHDQEQFTQEILPLEFELYYRATPVCGDYWSGEVEIAKQSSPLFSSTLGSQWRCVYRYCLSNPHTSGPLDWSINPIARELGCAKLSAFIPGC